MREFTSQGAVDWIQGERYKGLKNGLENTRALLAALGHPEERFRSVHIAGTNGKGSTAALVERALRQAGYRTGLYTSPYLCRYQERIRVNGVPIDDGALVRITGRLAEIAGELTGRGIYPTTFELGTALCFEYFREAGVEAAVIEVGLGGRFDSTNVITPEVSLLAAIGLDHMKTLGDTLSQIAGEKAGIIKPGVPAAAQAQGDEVLDVFRAACRERGSALYVAPEPEVLEITARGSRFALELPFLGRGEYEIRLPGRHQLKNASLALYGLDLLHARGFDRLTADNLRAGLAAARWPGRLEWLDGILLDGAHNPQGAQSLRDYLDEHFPDAPVTLLTGMMADKQIRECAAILAPCAQRVVATQVAYERAAPATAVGEIFAGFGVKTEVEPDLARALELARAHTEPDGVTVCAGSLYLVGDVRNLLVDDNGCI